MLRRPLTPEQQQAVLEAAHIVLDCYHASQADPKVVMPTPLHGALFRLKQAMEGRL